jgi:hypothetical protein
MVASARTDGTFDPGSAAAYAERSTETRSGARRELHLRVAGPSPGIWRFPSYDRRYN